MPTITLSSQGKPQSLTVPEGTTIRQLLLQQKLNEETILIKRNQAISHPEQVLEEGDAIEAVGVIFGG